MVTTKDRLRRQEECVGRAFENLALRMEEVRAPRRINLCTRQQRDVRLHLANLRMMIEQLEDLSDDDAGPEIHDNQGPIDRNETYSLKLIVTMANVNLPTI